MPTAVYAKGPDVETADCQNIVAYLVAVECANRNKCASSRLLDVRPSIVLQLSQMSGGSYVTACAGYIDAAFDQYKKQNAVAAPSAGVAFPTATGMGTRNNDSTFEIKNPFSPKLQEWQMEILGREQELKDLQAANGVKQPQIVPVTEFPTTYADLPFSERMENAKAGYEPFKGTSAYKEIKVESEDSYLKRQQEKDRMNLPMEEFCKKYPNESVCREKERRQERAETSVDQAQQKSGDSSGVTTPSGDSSGGATPIDNELPVKEGEIVFIL